MTQHSLASLDHRNVTNAFPLIVQSHLRWDFVWQRPQQLLSRMARSAPVLFVEEPIIQDEVRDARLDVSTPSPNVYRAVPFLPAAFRHDYDAAVLEIRTLVQRLTEKGGALDGKFSGAMQWFYTPMPAPAMLGAFNERGVVYDCMDELAQFRFAPTDLPARERLLLQNADVVFTGGYRLYKSKARFHDNVHFFGCGVDGDHFAKARAADTRVPDDVANLRQPIMGYYGVIDERIDYDLLRTLAEQNPDMSLVMVGPVVKVDPRDLPQGPNIHWLGQRDYAQLPAYVKAFDVCLMPFALNEATEYINPTKTLEYMAAGRPIVSTAVADVVHNFTPIVTVANSAGEFVAAVRRAARTPDEATVAHGIDHARQATWESIVSRMQRLIADAVESADAEVVAAEHAGEEEAATSWPELESDTGSTAIARKAAGAGEELGA